MRTSAAFLLFGLGLSLVALAPRARADETRRSETHLFWSLPGEVAKTGDNFRLGGFAGGLFSLFSNGGQAAAARRAALAGSMRPLSFRVPTWAERSQEPRLKEMRVPSLSWRF